MLPNRNFQICFPATVDCTPNRLRCGRLFPLPSRPKWRPQQAPASAFRFVPRPTGRPEQCRWPILRRPAQQKCLAAALFDFGSGPVVVRTTSVLGAEPASTGESPRRVERGEPNFETPVHFTGCRIPSGAFVGRPGSITTLYDWHKRALAPLQACWIAV